MTTPQLTPGLRRSMAAPEMDELDENRLSLESRLFAADLFARFPSLRQHAAIERLEGRDTWSLVVTVPAPSGDPRSGLVVWVDRGDEPSVEFGGWHTHESVWGWNVEDGAERAALLDLIAGIFEDRFVACEDAASPGAGTATILDMAEQNALLEELTSKYSPSRARLRSWSGKHDREVGLDDLQGGEPA